MENATKALLIAGGIFLAIVIITVGVYTYVSLHDIAKSQDELSEHEQLVAFNKKYDSYNKQLLHGTDLITLMNMAYEDNLKSDDEIKVEIQAYLFDKSAYIYNESGVDAGKRTPNGDMFSLDQDVVRQFSKSSVKDDRAKVNDFKRRVFECVDVKYNGEDTGTGTGRICYMEFDEVPLNDYTHK